METMQFYGASYVSKYLGVSLPTIHNWVKKKPKGFIAPDALVTSLSGRNAAMGWSPESLPLLREWYVKAHKIDGDTAIARWSLIDNDLIRRHAKASAHHVDPGIHPDQTSIPLSKESEEAAA